MTADRIKHLFRTAFICVLILNSIALSVILLYPGRKTGGSAREKTSLRKRFSQSGDWGTLRCGSALIEAPEEFIPIFGSNRIIIKWFLPGHTTESATRFFLSAGLSQKECANITFGENTFELNGILTVMPPPDIVLNLGSQTRGKLYGMLGEWEENGWQHEPVKINYTHFDEFFRSGHITKRAARLIRKMSYRRGNTMCFSDYHLLMHMLESDEEKSDAVKFLSRKEIVLARLVIDPAQPIEPLLAYWAGDNIDSGSLIRSLHSSPGRKEIDITLLLPPRVRRLIYTYPDPETIGRRQIRNCYWTAANFFTNEANNELCAVEEFIKHLDEYYIQVPEPDRLGDIIVIFESDGYPVHAAVHIAGEIVFSKNGWYHTMPWGLFSRQEVLDFYEKGVRTAVFRRKSAVRQPASASE